MEVAVYFTPVGAEANLFVNVFDNCDCRARALLRYVCNSRFGWPNLRLCFDLKAQLL